MNMRALVARPTACFPQLSRGWSADWPCVVRMASRLDDERYLNLSKLYEAGARPRRTRASANGRKRAIRVETNRENVWS